MIRKHEQLEIFDPAEVGERFVPASRGYAAAPGKGPDGERCRGCAHYCAEKLETNNGNERAYRRCGLVCDRWTRGKALEIRAKAPACEKWEAKGADE